MGLNSSAPGQQPAALQPVADYVLGPGDQFSVTVADLETDFAGKNFRVDLSGDVTLPFAGRVHAAALSSAGLEEEVRSRLGRVLKNPDVSITITAFGSRSVSLLGAVNSPGIRQIEGGKTLFEVLSMAGGLRADAGYRIYVTRDLRWGPLPLAGGHPDAAGRYSTVAIRVANILNAADTGENIAVLQGDSISVPKADVVYAVGSVVKPGGFPMNEHETLSALQVVSLAEGMQRVAAADRARILRIVDGSPERQELAVDLKSLMAGKGSDIPLRAGDILFVPNSAAKSAGYRTIDAIVNAATGMAIYK